MAEHGYVHILVSIIHHVPEMTICRYCIGFSMEDTRMRDFDIDNWATPDNRRRILSLMCEDWLTDDCTVVSCEQITSAVQWEGVR